MAQYGVMPCNYTASVLFEDTFRLCAPYFKTLQTCPDASSINETTKYQIVNQTGVCMDAVWSYDPWPTLLVNYTSESPPVVKANSSCKYPDFEPIIKKACAFDYDLLSTEHCVYGNKSTTFWQPRKTTYPPCFAMGLVEYWRCTNQVPYDQVADCVIQNTPKIDWLNQYIVYSGADSCETPHYWIQTQIITVVLAFFGAFIIPYISIAWSAIKRRFSNDEKKSTGDEVQSFGGGPFDFGSKHLAQQHATRIGPDGLPVESYPSTDDEKPWSLETIYTLSANDLLASLGGELLSIFLTIVVLRNSGQAGFDGMSSTILEMFIFFSIRPRAAPLIGFLGFFKGWSGTAMSELVTDALLSVFVGPFMATTWAWALSGTGYNPATPITDVRILALGALLTGIPTFVGLILVFLGSICLGCLGRGGGPIAGVCIFFGIIFAIIICVLCLPFVAVWEIGVMLWIATFGRKKAKEEKDTHGKRAKTWIETPLSMPASCFRFIYVLMVLTSIVVNVGNWMFFVKYMILEGSLYCPSSSTAVAVITILVPHAIKLPVQLLGWYIK